MLLFAGCEAAGVPCPAAELEPVEGVEDVVGWVEAGEAARSDEVSLLDGVSWD